MQRFIVGNCLSSDSLLDCVVPLGSIIVTLLFLIYITMYQTVWILVLLECTWTTLTLPFLHLPYLIVIQRSIINWNILISGLNLNVNNTELTITSLRQKLQSFNDYTINIDVDGIQVKQTFIANLLGLIQMISLGSPTYMYMTSKKESQVHTAVKIYKQGLIEPHFDYCTSVLDGLLQQLNDINSKNYKITLPKSHCSCTQLLNLLDWDNISIRRAKQKAKLTCKCTNNLTPPVICLPWESQ